MCAAQPTDAADGRLAERGEQSGVPLQPLLLVEERLLEVELDVLVALPAQLPAPARMRRSARGRGARRG